MHRITLPKGDTLYREGEIADLAYLVLDGEIEMQRLGLPVTVGSGSVIGFAGLLGTAYGSTALTPNGCHLLAFTRKELRGIIRSDPDRALQIIDGIIELLNKVNKAQDAIPHG